MKRSIVALLLSLSVSARLCACIDYPYGDDLRFTLLNPDAFGFRDFNYFYYSSHYLFPVVDTVKHLTTGEKMNIDLWRKRCNAGIPDSAIYEAVYSDGYQPHNPFVTCLVQRKDHAALDYLDFARTCTGLTDLISDPWERHSKFISSLRRDQIQLAIERAGATRDDDIRTRYAFQAIRMAYYDEDSAQVKSVYKKFFSNRKNKTIIDYWALHFRALSEPEGALRNYYAALVFANAPDKRVAVYYAYDRKISISSVLALTKNKEEKAAVWLMEGLHRHGRALECMQRINELSPGNEWMDFLLLREVNKLEDWICTPYYTWFEPSVSAQGDEDLYNSAALMQQLIDADRAYAKDVADFATSAKGSRTRHAGRILLEAYLLQLAQKPKAALAELAGIETVTGNDTAMAEQVDMIRSLCIISAQDSGQARIPAEVKPVLMRENKRANERFLLAISRELEFHGNSIEAALILSQVNPDNLEWEQRIFWKMKNDYRPFYNVENSNYFDYIDISYTTGQVSLLVAAVENQHATDDFTSWEYHVAKRELPRLYDLLGTKYMRLNLLHKALKAFEKVNDTLWTSAHYPYAEYLDANPFYTNLYNEHSKTSADSTSRYNKTSIVRELILRLEKANDTTDAHRAYNYFLAANCYLNMTYYGNSWMMKRYWWTRSARAEEMPGGRDFYTCELAQSYYLKAFSVSKSKEFSALCLRMAGRCEDYRMNYVAHKRNDFYWSWVVLNTRTNRYYQQLQKAYPRFYDDLISNCYSFDEYFKYWKNAK